MEVEIQNQLLAYVFGVAVILGAVVNKTNFCTMGAVSDWVNMGKTGRLWAWFSAIALAMIGVAVFEMLGVVSVDSTLPPYQSAQFAWSRYILGGFLFGIGMTLAGGCGNKTLVNIGGGNMKSVLVLVIAGFMAYLMTKTAFYEQVFYSWVSALTVDLGEYGLSSQALPDMLGALFGADSTSVPGAVLGFSIAAVLLFFALRSRHFLKNTNNVIAALVVGLAIIAGWYLTGGPLGQGVIEAVDWMDEKPLGVGVQSYTFINPMGETLYYLGDPASLLRVTFGVVAVAGVIAGSLGYALVAKKFSLVWFKSMADFVKHFVGAILMGVGGVLAMGCTIGQGITGTSTLALGSFLALGSIIFGSALTMKVQYYQMVYDDEATFMAAFLSSLVDMHVLPGGLRRLEQP
ncbi:MAG: YeeE/YedE family protein [Thiogranum sp.]